MMTRPTLSPDDILIRAQDTPNPNAVKFIVNVSLKDVGNATFTAKEQCENLPLARALFDVRGLEQIYFFQNTLTVTHRDELPVEILKDQVISVLKTRMNLHDPEFESLEETKRKQKPDRSSLPEDLRQI